MIGLGEGAMVLILAFIFCSMLRTQNDLVFSYAPVKDFLRNLQIISFLPFFPPLKARELKCLPIFLPFLQSCLLVY